MASPSDRASRTHHYRCRTRLRFRQAWESSRTLSELKMRLSVALRTGFAQSLHPIHTEHSCRSGVEHCNLCMDSNELGQRPLSEPFTTLTIDRAKETVHINDFIHCITILATGRSLCLAARMISTMSSIMVKAAKEMLIATPTLLLCQCPH